MPHLQIQYSSNIEKFKSLDALCTVLSQTIAELGYYPLGGIRVRAMPMLHYSIADQHPDNQFVDMIFRIGVGRSDAQKSETGERLIETAEDFFSEELASEHFMLSLEIIEIERSFSWKKNSVHQRLDRENT